MKYSGCNYYINQGKHPEEPVGTATSMHDCGGCDRLSYCLVLKDVEIWEYNKDIEKEMKDDWNKTTELASKQNTEFKNKGVI